MSSSFNVIRKHSSDPHAIRIKELTQALAKSRGEANTSDLESEDVRSQGRMDHSTIKLNDEKLKFATGVDANPDHLFEFPIEPDGQFLRLWLMLDHLGNRIHDMSGLLNRNRIFLRGHPTLYRAEIDMGFMQTSVNPGFPAMAFNLDDEHTPEVLRDFIRVDDNATDLDFTSYANGFSLAFRFNCIDFSNDFDDDNNLRLRRFAGKVTNVTNYWNVAFDSGGDIDFEVVHNGTSYKREFSDLVLNTWYQVVVTYNPNAGATAADRIKMYVDGVQGAAATTFTLAAPSGTLTNLYIARASTGGYFKGFIQDFRVYMNKVLTQTEVTNLNNNELTIDNIAKGNVFVIQYSTINNVLVYKKHRFVCIGELFPLSTTRRHRFNVLQDNKAIKIHKFSIINDVPNKISHHKFNILTKVANALKRHKYNITGKVTSTKTHKFNIIQHLDPILKIHKFNIINKISTTTIHKYNILNSLSTTKTHKYDMGGIVSTIKIHKYNVLRDDFESSVFYNHYLD